MTRLDGCAGSNPAQPHPRPNHTPEDPMPQQTEPTADQALRERIADAIRNAACPGDCDQTEEQCREQRIQPVVWHFGVLAEVEGTPEQFAAALLPLFAEERAAALREGEAHLHELADTHVVDAGEWHSAAYALRDPTPAGPVAAGDLPGVAS